MDFRAGSWSSGERKGRDSGVQMTVVRKLEKIK